MWKIERDVLDLILEASKSTYPKEFAGALRARNDVITELILVPGTFSSYAGAMLQFHTLPIDRSVVGTIHSHPSPIPYPSAQDLALFDRWGRIHIIVAAPFNERSWRAFDGRGEEVPLEVIGP